MLQKIKNKIIIECAIDEYNHLQVKVGKEKELEASLRRLRGQNVDISQEAAEIRVTFQI